MTKAASLFFIGLVWLFATVPSASGQDVPAWTAQHGAFAFPNSEGTSLLTTAPVADPDSLRSALCGGRRLTVRFNRRQQESRNSSGRQVPQNVANTGGSIFRITDGKVGPDATCFLAADALIAGTAMLPLSKPPRGTRCSQDAYPLFQADKSRPVVGCWPIARSASGVEIVVIEFARRLTSALACLAVIERDRRVYVDYSATFNGPGADLWRVDDGGEILPETFDVVFLLKRGDTYWLAIDWAAAEGHALYLYAAEGGSQFHSLISDSWYRSPL